MYLREVKITNVRSIAELTWRLPDGVSLPGWHVIVGDNGCGKTTFLQAVSLAAIGPRDSEALWTSWAYWVRSQQSECTIRLNLDCGPKVGADRTPIDVEFHISLPILPGHAMHGGWRGKSDFFSIGYGPFRRFGSGDSRLKEVAAEKPRLGRLLSVFEDSFTLTDCLGWLQELQYKNLEKDSVAGELLRQVTAFINQPDFLPFHARLNRVTSDGVFFVDGNDAEVRIDKLSDGYRSILSLTFDMIRHLATQFGPDRLFDSNDPTKIVAEGVVLIDEVDAHLHPTWQRRIGLWFREHFPNIQFIVTTHSPLVCQAADVGTVFRLPSPGSDEEGHFITGVDLSRLLDGNILEAFGTGVFGEGITRSDRSRQHLKRLAELNMKEINAGLSEAEQHEQTELRSALPTTAHTLSMQP